MIDFTDNKDGTVTINGTKYSYEFFDEFGCSFPGMIGQILRVDKKCDGIVTVTRLHHLESEGDNKSMIKNENNQ